MGRPPWRKATLIYWGLAALMSVTEWPVCCNQPFHIHVYLPLADSKVFIVFRQTVFEKERHVTSNYVTGHALPLGNTHPLEVFSNFNEYFRIFSASSTVTWFTIRHVMFKVTIMTNYMIFEPYLSKLRQRRWGWTFLTVHLIAHCSNDKGS